MTKNGKTYRFTVKLRKKPLQGGRFSLILDYYNGNVEYLSEEQRGERIRQHLGLYLIPENTPEAKLTNEKTMKLAMEILEEKKAELEVLKEEGLHPIVKKSKNEEQTLNVMREDCSKKKKALIRKLNLLKRKKEVFLQNFLLQLQLYNKKLLLN